MDRRPTGGDWKPVGTHVLYKSDQPSIDGGKMNILAVETFLEEFAPPRLAESWDNVGLLIGDRQAEVRKIMTCLTVTPDTVEEAISSGAELIVTHHPMPFSAVKRLTNDTTVGRILLKL